MRKPNQAPPRGQKENSFAWSTSAAPGAGQRLSPMAVEHKGEGHLNYPRSLQDPLTLHASTLSHLRLHKQACKPKCAIIPRYSKQSTYVRVSSHSSDQTNVIPLLSAFSMKAQIHGSHGFIMLILIQLKRSCNLKCSLISSSHLEWLDPSSQAGKGIGTADNDGLKTLWDRSLQCFNLIIC